MPEVDFTKAIAGVTALGAAFAVLATATGAFDQMQRDYPGWTAGVFAAAVVAGLLVIGAGAAKDWLQDALLAAALTAFAFAAIAGLVFLIDARRDRPPPFVTATLKAGELTATVKSDEMASSDTVDVFVGATTDAPPTDSSPVDELYEARLGPSASGTFELPLDVAVPAHTPPYTFVTVRAFVIEPDAKIPRGACFPAGVSGTTVKSQPGCIVIRVPASGS